MAQIGSLSVKLGLVTVEWDKATENAKRSAKQLQSSFNELGANVKELYKRFQELGGTTSLTALGLGELVKSTLEFSNQTKDLASAYDISIAKTLQFKDAVMTSGGNAEQAGTMLSKMFSEIANAQEGTSASIALFESMNISVEDLIKLKPEDQINKIVEGISHIGNKAEQIKVIKSLVGKGGVTLSFEELVEKVNQSTEEFQGHDKALQKFAETSENLKRSMDNLKLAFADLFSPFIGDGLIGVEAFKTALLAITSYVVVSQFAQIAIIATEIAEAMAAGAVFTSAMTLNIPMLVASLAAIGAVGAYKFFKSNKPTEHGGAANNGEGSSSDAESTRKLESDALAARVKSMQEMLGITGEMDAAKLKAIAGDKLSAQLDEIAVTKKIELNKADTTYAENLAKQKLTKREILLYENEHKTAIETANQKAENSVKLAIAERDEKVKAIKEEISWKKISYDYDRADDELRMAALTMDAYAIQIAQERNNKERELNKLKEDYDKNIKGKSQKEKDQIDIGYQQDKTATENKSKRKIELIKAERNKQIESITQQSTYQQILNDLDADKLRMDMQHYYISQNEYDIQVENLALQKRLAEFEQKRVDARARLGEGTVLTETLAGIDKEVEGEKRLHEIRLQAIALTEYQQTTFSEGWDKAYRDFIEATKQEGKKGGDEFNSVISNMNSALDNFVETGKLSFSDLTRSIINDLLKIELRASASNLLKSLGGNSGGGSLFSFIGSLFTGGNSLSSMPAGVRAAGGDVTATDSYLVGEKGPEMFVPNTGGTIVPTNQIGSMGSTTNVTNYNINAIDTKSFEDRILGSSKAVWAANAYGAKNISVGRGRT